MIKSLLIALGLILCTGTALSQKALILEKRSSLRAKKFFVGDRLVYKLEKQEKHWFDETIVDIDIDAGFILFENRAVAIDDIYAIQIRDGGRFAKRLSMLLTTFSYSWSFWTLVSAAFGDPISATTIGIGIGSFTVGQLLKLAFFKTYRVSKRKRLRLIDLTFYDSLPSRT